MKMKPLNIMIAVASLSITASAAVEPLMEQISWANVDTNNTFLSADSEIATNALIILTESHSHVTNAVEGSRQANPAKNLASNDGFYGPDAVSASVPVVYETGETSFKTNAYSIGKSWYYLEYTIQNISVTNLQLAELRFDLIARWNNKGGEIELSYQGGDLSVPVGLVLASRAVPGSSQSGVWGLSDAKEDIIFDLTGIPDAVLDPGESATFRLRHPVDVPATAVDNLMFLGEFGVAPANGPPAFTDNPLRLEEPATLAVLYTNDISGFAFDPESDPVEFTKVDGPDWLTVTSDGVISGTPTNSGLEVFTVSATDTLNGGSAQTSLEIVVLDPALEVFEMIGWTGGNWKSAHLKTPGAQDISGEMFEIISPTNTTGIKTMTGNSDDKTYGTIFMTPIAEDNQWEYRFLTNNAYALVVSNASGFDMDLEGIYFDYKRFDKSPQTWEIKYVSGDLDDAGPVLIGTDSAAFKDTWYDFDVPLSSLSDTTLAMGEQAVFEMNFYNATGSNIAASVDNLMVRMIKGDSTDTDNDGMADIWEIMYFGSITNSDGTADFEPDGFTDYSEFIAGTNPTNQLSLLAIESITKGAGLDEYLIQWQSASGRTYRIVSVDNLVFGTWDTTNASGIAATPATNATTVTTSLSPVFFRVEVE